LSGKALYLRGGMSKHVVISHPARVETLICERARKENISPTAARAGTDRAGEGQ
jgi:hypothetical protein